MGIREECRDRLASLHREAEAVLRETAFDAPRRRSFLGLMVLFRIPPGPAEIAGSPFTAYLPEVAEGV